MQDALIVADHSSTAGGTTSNALESLFLGYSWNNEPAAPWFSNKKPQPPGAAGNFLIGPHYNSRIPY